MVRPDDDPTDRPWSDDRSADELREAIRRSDDKERAIGLVAAPIAAIVGITISSASINYARTHHQSVQVYDELTYVLLGLAVLILVSSLLRKRLFQGITLALFGLAVFQLHYTYVGFAAPFILAGAWYLVRSYRLQQSLKRAEGDAGAQPARSRAQPGARRAPTGQQALHAADLGTHRRARRDPRRSSHPRTARLTAADRASASAGLDARAAAVPPHDHADAGPPGRRASTAGRTNTPADECCVVDDAVGRHAGRDHRARRPRRSSSRAGGTRCPATTRCSGGRRSV